MLSRLSPHVQWPIPEKKKIFWIAMRQRLSAMPQSVTLHKIRGYFVENCNKHNNKKAVLSQRWPRNAPYTWVPWKFSGLPEYAHGYYSQHFSRAFVRIDPLNVPTKFEVRSFIRSWDNRGYPQNLDSPWIRPRSLFSKIFNRLIFRLTL